MTAKDEIARQHAAELTAMGRDVVDANRYVVLGTAHADGHPRVSPVFYNHHEYGAFYWVSSPDSQHSHNLAGDPRVSAVVFDSTTPPPQNRAVYLTGTACEVPEADLAAEIPLAFAQAAAKDARAFTAEELSGDADLRLYRLDVTTAEVHARGGHPLWGLGIDTRLPVTLWQRVAGEQLVEDVGDGAGGEGAAEGGVGVGVEVGEDGADAEADGALLVGLVRVQGERRVGLAEGGVHLVEPDLRGRAGQRPAGAGAAPGRHQPGVPQRTEGLADQGRVAGQAGRDALGGERGVAAAGRQLQPAEGVDRGGQAGVRGHG